MDENNNNVFQNEQAAEPIILDPDMAVPEKKPLDIASLVLGILSIVFGLLIALVGDILGIIGLILAIVKRKDKNTRAGLILSIIGLVVSIGNNILGAVLLTQIIG